jgi:hypothetical protein
MLWVVNGPDGQLVPQATSVNSRFQTITAKILHFSEYSPGLDALDAPSDPPPPTGGW